MAEWIQPKRNPRNEYAQKDGVTRVSSKENNHSLKMVPRLYNTYPVTVHSNLLDPGNAIAAKGHNAIKLWYLCRAIDEKGSGKVSIVLAAAAQCFGVSAKTIRRYIDQGRSLGFFRYARVQSGLVHIFYGSLPNVCVALGITDFGACAKVAIADVRMNRALATELVAQKLQRQSKYLAAKAAKLKPIAEERLIESCAESNTGTFDLLFKTDRFIGVSYNFATYGASQQTIGDRQNLSPETVKRRLSAKYRDRYHLDRINRIQLLRQIPPDNVQEVPIKQSLFERLMQNPESRDRTMYFTDSNGECVGKGFIAKEMRATWDLVDGSSKIARNFVSEDEGLKAIAHCEDMAMRLFVDDLQEAHDSAIQLTKRKYGALVLSN